MYTSTEVSRLYCVCSSETFSFGSRETDILTCLVCFLHFSTISTQLVPCCLRLSVTLCMGVPGGRRHLHAASYTTCIRETERFDYCLLKTEAEHLNLHISRAPIKSARWQQANQPEASSQPAKEQNIYLQVSL